MWLEVALLDGVYTGPCSGEQGRGRIWWQVGRQPSQYERCLAVGSSVICVARGRGGTEGVPMDGGMLIAPEQRGRCTVPIWVWRRALVVNCGACPLSSGGACLISSTLCGYSNQYKSTIKPGHSTGKSCYVYWFYQLCKYNTRE